MGALKWNFVAKDHWPLKYLELFKVLHQGNIHLQGKENLLANAWGKPVQP
jgi:hypothetical protein